MKCRHETDRQTDRQRETGLRSRGVVQPLLMQKKQMCQKKETEKSDDELFIYKEEEDYRVPNL